MHRRVVLLSVLLAGITPGIGEPGGDLPRKKLIEYGWDAPDPAFVREHLREMEERPFDGVVMTLPGAHDAFDTRAWNAAALEPQVAALKAVEWRRFTDNFLLLNASDVSEMSWFDDAQWETIVRNVRLVTRAAREGRCAGIAFDPEPYAGNPWQYPGRYTGRKFDDVAAQVRRRGGQLLGALQAEMPGLRLLTLFQLGIFGDLLGEPDARVREAKLSAGTYALLPAFVDGLLEAARPDVRIVDGNEPSYYYASAEDYLRAYHRIHERARALVAPEVRSRYASQVEAGMAVYLDYLMATWMPEDDFPTRYATPADRLRWLQHDTYWALATADEYAWCYGERLDWWRGKVPEGVEEAIRAARQAIESGKPLGFEVKEVAAKARKEMDAAIAARVVRRTLTVPRLAGNAKPPQIDGKIEDKVWQVSTPLAPFLARATAAREKPRAETSARVLAGSKALYVAFRCQDAEQAKPDPRGSPASRSPGSDGVELVVRRDGPPGSYHRFAIDVSGLRAWATSLGDGETAVWDPRWKGASRPVEGGWTAEVEIPWDLIGGPPGDGSKLEANLCRLQPDGREVSCWSSVLRRAEEPDHLGEWRF